MAKSARRATLAICSALRQVSTSITLPQREQERWWWCRSALLQKRKRCEPSANSIRSSRCSSCKISTARKTVARPTFGSRDRAISHNCSTVNSDPAVSTSSSASVRRWQVMRSPFCLNAERITSGVTDMAQPSFVKGAIEIRYHFLSILSFVAWGVNLTRVACSPLRRLRGKFPGPIAVCRVLDQAVRGQAENAGRSPYIACRAGNVADGGEKDV